MLRFTIVVAFGLLFHFSWIYSSLPENKQMLALSATYPEVLAQHLTAYMRNPTFVRMNSSDPALLGLYFITDIDHIWPHFTTYANNIAFKIEIIITLV